MNTKQTSAKSTSFTTRIDANLKAQLEQIAKFEDRSASYITNQAIQTLVEERQATHELIKTGLALVEQYSIHKETDVNAWLDAPISKKFPAAQR